MHVCLIDFRQNIFVNRMGPTEYSLLFVALSIVLIGLQKVLHYFYIMYNKNATLPGLPFDEEG